MDAWSVLAALSAGVAGALASPGPGFRGGRSAPSRPSAPEQGLLRRHRVTLAVLAGAAGIAFVDGATGVAASAVLAAVVWVTCSRAEPPARRREREAVRRGLPHVTRLLGVVLAGGTSVPGALGAVAEALPGPASAPLARARAALAVGVPVEQVFADLARTPGLEPLGRALARSADSGARIADAVARLTVQLAAEQASSVEDRARTVGIRAALPLGLCLLPAFLLLGIVPVVAGALGALRW